MGRSRIPLIVVAFLSAVGAVRADVSGFGDNGNGWSLNPGPYGGGTIGGNVFTPTLGGYDSAGSMRGLEATSAFYLMPQPYLAGFTATFTYQATDLLAAFGPPSPVGGDGVAFILQNDPRGAAAVGGTGHGLGYSDGDQQGSAILDSAGLELNIFWPETVGSQLFVTAGSAPGSLQDFPRNPSGNVALNSGNPIDVSLTYSAALDTVSETLTDTVTSASFSTAYANVGIAAALGQTTAFVGFSGSDGEATALQTISNFTYHADLPWQNPVQPLDVNVDNTIAPLDVLTIINELNLDGPHALNAIGPGPNGPFYDVNGDGNISPLDALEVINYLNSQAGAAASVSASLAAAQSLPVPEPAALALMAAGVAALFGAFGRDRWSSIEA